MKGRLIVVEGLDRAGKSTQVDQIINKLRQYDIKVELVKFPDRTTAIGQMINTYLTSSESTLSDEAIHLLFSANRWERFADMQRKLNEGIWLVVDRYSYSGAAFTAAKGLDLNWCLSPDRGLLQPDLVVFLDVSESVAASRGGYGEERYEKVEFQRIVRHQFAQVQKVLGEHWAWLSADESPENVFNSIWSQIDPLLSG